VPSVVELSPVVELSVDPVVSVEAVVDVVEDVVDVWSVSA
jgi:hypothetical protein